MYALPIRLYGRRMHTCNLRRQEEDKAEPQYQFIYEVSKGKEIFRIFNGTKLIDLEGNMDYPIGEFACEVYQVNELPPEKKESVLPGPKHRSAAYLRIKIGPERFNSQAGVPLLKAEGTTSLKEFLPLCDEQLLLSHEESETQNKSRKRINHDLMLKRDKLGNGIHLLYVELQFQKEPKGAIYTNTLLIHVLKKGSELGHLRKAVIDFGSEALQMRVYYPESRSYDDIDVLSKISQYYLAMDETEIRKEQGQDFYQQLEEKHLFKSDIFIKKKGGKSTPNEAPYSTKQNKSQVQDERISEDSRELVSVLTSTHIPQLWEEHRFLAPNLKLSLLSSFFEHEIKFKHEQDNPLKQGGAEDSFAQLKPMIYRIALNKFLHTLFLSIRKKTSKDYFPYVHLTLLIPNVYDQSLIADLMKSLLKDWQEILFSHSSYQFAGLEIQIMSESDATFLGMANQLGAINYKDKFLIIDGGKGTTDLSIIRVDKPNSHKEVNSFSSIYRDGMVGAGNLISYAFMETILAIYYSEDEEDRRRFMKKFLLSGSKEVDMSEVYTFLRYIERLKKSFNHRSTDKLNKGEIREKIRSEYKQSIPARTWGEQELGLKEYLDTQENPLRILNRWIGNSLNLLDTQTVNSSALSKADFRPLGICDDFGFIKREVEQMAERFCSNLTDLHIEGEPLRFKKILFAGRAFLFQNLFEEMKKRLSTFLEAGPQAGDRDIIKAPEPKKVCLSGALGENPVNHFSSLVGIPFLKKYDQTEIGDAEKNFNTYKETQSSKEDPAHRQAEETHSSPDPGIAPSQGRLPKVWQWVKKQFSHITNWFQGNWVIQQEASASQWNNRNFSEINIDFFLEGSNQISKNSRLLINGKPVVYEQNMQERDFKLFFGGEDFYFRTLEADGQSIHETKALRLSQMDIDKSDPFLVKSVFPFIDLEPEEIVVSSVPTPQELENSREEETNSIDPEILKQLSQELLTDEAIIPENLDQLFSDNPSEHQIPEPKHIHAKTNGHTKSTHSTQGITSNGHIQNGKVLKEHTESGDEPKNILGV